MFQNRRLKFQNQTQKNEIIRILVLFNPSEVQNQERNSQNQYFNQSLILIFKAYRIAVIHELFISKLKNLFYFQVNFNAIKPQ
ncbi:MAG: hypothetical protein CL555_06625 [Algoriphagus sp.]|nr:hypothetical protein [Algoriphagus sp.]